MWDVRQGTEPESGQGGFVRIEPIVVIGPALHVYLDMLVEDVMKWPEKRRLSAMPFIEDGTLAWWECELALVVAGTAPEVDKVLKTLSQGWGPDIRSHPDQPSLKWPGPHTSGGSQFSGRMPTDRLTREDGTAVATCWIRARYREPISGFDGAMHVNIGSLWYWMTRWEFPHNVSVRMPRGFVRVPVIDASLPRP